MKTILIILLLATPCFAQNYQPPTTYYAISLGPDMTVVTQSGPQGYGSTVVWQASPDLTIVRPGPNGPNVMPVINPRNNLPDLGLTPSQHYQRQPLW